MVHLRATKKVLDRLKVAPREAEPAASVLGDWFVNRFVWNRQPLLILMSRASRLAILDVARDLRGLPDRVPDMIARRLTSLGVDEERIYQELRTMGEVVVARTDDRAAVSAMNQLVRSACVGLDYRIPRGGSLADVEWTLGSTLTMVAGTGYIKPAEDAWELLMRSC